MKKYYGLLFGAKLTDEEIIEELVGKSREFFIERFRLFVDFNLLNYIIGQIHTGNPDNYQDALGIFYTRKGLLLLAIALEIYSHLKNLEAVRYTLNVMIIRIIMTNFMLTDDFNYASFSSRLQMLKITLKFCYAATLIVCHDLLFLKNYTKLYLAK